MRPLRYLNGRTLSPVPAEARQFQHQYRTPQACGGAYSSPAAHAREPGAERLTAYAKVLGRSPNSGLGTGSGPLKSCFSRGIAANHCAVAFAIILDFYTGREQARIASYKSQLKSPRTSTLRRGPFAGQPRSGKLVKAKPRMSRGRKATGL